MSDFDMNEEEFIAAIYNTAFDSAARVLRWNSWLACDDIAAVTIEKYLKDRSLGEEARWNLGYASTAAKNACIDIIRRDKRFAELAPRIEPNEKYGDSSHDIAAKVDAQNAIKVLLEGDFLTEKEKDMLLSALERGGEKPKSNLRGEYQAFRRLSRKIRETQVFLVA